MKTGHNLLAATQAFPNPRIRQARARILNSSSPLDIGGANCDSGIEVEVRFGKDGKLESYKARDKGSRYADNASNWESLTCGFRERVDDGYSSVEEWRVVKEYSRKGHGKESSPALK
jgi:hypothetical protein